jgi:polyisoprenoid-binding protein YceI
MDPITGAIVSYLSTAAAGMAAGATAEAGKLMISDAYQSLKSTIQKKFGSESKAAKAVAALEQEPDFKPNQEALAGRLEQAGAAEDTELQKLAAALVEALRQSEEGQAALAKYQVSISNSEVGVVGDHARVSGGIHFGRK